MEPENDRARVAALKTALRTARAALDKGSDLARAVQEARGAALSVRTVHAEETAWVILGEMEAAALAIDALGLGE